jgi:hypothetical protein
VPQETPRFKEVAVFEYPVTPNETSLMMSRQPSVNSVLGLHKPESIKTRSNSMNLFDLYDKDQDKDVTYENRSIFSVVSPIP